MPGLELRRVTVDCRRYTERSHGLPIDVFYLRSGSVELSAMTYGGIITRLTAPDRYGVSANVVLGHDRPEAYFVNPAYLGSIIGRYANRIGSATFGLDGKTYSLDANERGNHLHGGTFGFDRRVWTATTAMDSDAARVTFWRISEDGEQGYPGALGVSVTYTLTAEGDILLDYEARAHAPTIVNLTQHTYFNLSGDSHSDIRSHELTIHADHITAVGRALLPTGALLPVDGTPFDFRDPARIGDRLGWQHEQPAASPSRCAPPDSTTRSPGDAWTLRPLRPASSSMMGTC
jgi:aldose 1-epimerase